jgi:hypothetical protein
MSDIDLATALNMFKQGTQDLAFQRSLSAANEQVQQIKASDANEQQQRAQLQQVSNGLVTHMAGLGIPATTMQMVAGAIGPKQYGNANQMAMDANLTGNSELMGQAKQQQSFEQNPEYKIATMQAKMAAQDPLRRQAADEKRAEFDNKQFTKFSSDIDKTAASSRSAFGQWSNVEGRGDRLKAILGEPSSWQAMTPEALELVKEGVVQMSKGGAMTQEEHKTLSPFIAKLQAAKAQTALTGKPTPVDLSGYAGLFSNIIDREGQAAQKNIKDIILARATGNMKLAGRDEDQFKLTVADRLNKQAGLSISPDDIILDKKKGVTINPKALSSSSSESSSMAPQPMVRMVRNKQTGQMMKITSTDGRNWFPVK